MSFLLRIEKTIKKNFNVWDLAMIKWVGVLFGLLVGAYFPDFIKQNATILTIVIVLIGIRLAYKMLYKKK